MEKILIGLFVFFVMNFAIEVTPMVFAPAREEAQVVWAIGPRGYKLVEQKTEHSRIVTKIATMVLESFFIIGGAFCIYRGKTCTKLDYSDYMGASGWYQKKGNEKLIDYGIVLICVGILMVIW